MDENNLPPFARELLRRKKQNQNSLSQSLPRPLYPQDYSINNSSLIDNETDFHQSYNNQEEIASLRNTIVELEQKIAQLTSKHKSEKQLQMILEKEQETTAELARNLDKVNDDIKENEDRSAAYLEQIVQIQSMIDHKDEVIDLKNTMISKLNEEYQQLKKDYDSIMKQTSDQIEELGNLRNQISNLNETISPLRSLKKRPIQPDPIFPPPHSNRNHDSDYRMDDQFPPENNFNDYQPNHHFNQNHFDDDFLNQPSNNRIPDNSFDTYGLDSQSQQINHSYNEPPIQTQPKVHAALVDNISFDYDSVNKIHAEIEIEPNLNKEAVEKQLMELQIRREDLQSLLNKSPSKTLPLAESKRMRLQNETELAEIEQKISKLKLLIKQNC